MWKPYAAAAKSLQSCPTLCDPVDGSPPGSPIPGILQAGTLEWVAISFSNVWKWKVKMRLLSHVRLLVTPWTAAHQAPFRPWDFPGKSTGVGCHCLLWWKPYVHNLNSVINIFLYLLYPSIHPSLFINKSILILVHVRVIADINILQPTCYMIIACISSTSI